MREHRGDEGANPDRRPELKHPAERSLTCWRVISSTPFYRTGCLRLGLANIFVCDMATSVAPPFVLRLMDILENTGNRSP